MKKLIVFAMLIAMTSLSTLAGGFHYHHGPYSHHGSSVSFYVGAYPGYYAYPSYPAYAYPSYSYYDYGYSRPNYAVSGTLFGALVGGLIGNSVHHQGWEGAGIGAATGLVLGGIAEHNVRARERAYYSAPTVSYPQPNTISSSPTVNDAPTVPNAPPAPAAPTFQSSSSMSSANSLFGR